MASIALGIAGAGLGSLFGNPMLGFSLGMTLGGLVFPQSTGGRGKLDDLRVTGSGWGTSIPKLWGDNRVGGTVIWSTDLVEHSSGGKGGAPASFSYSVSCAVLVGEGPITRIDKILADNDVVLFDYAASPQTKYTIRFYDGTQTAPDSYMDAHTFGGGQQPIYKGLAYVVFQDLDLSQFGNRMPQLNFEVIAGTPSAGTIVRDIAHLCGLTDDDIDVSLISETAVTGYISPNRDQGKTILEPLLQFYAIDSTEVDGVLRYLPRGGESVVTVPAEDLGTQDWPPGETPETALESTILQDLELPRTLDLTYFSKEANYEQNTQQGIRTTKGDLQQSDTVNTPLTLFDDEARQGAQRILYERWRARFTHKFTLPFSYLALIPGSPLILPVLDSFKRVRITGVDVGFIGLLKFESVEDDDVGVYCQVVTGGDGTRTLPTVQGIYPVTFYAWSGLELRDADKAEQGFYVVGTWSPEGTGGAVYYSLNAGVSYTRAGSLTQRGEFGLTTSTLADGTLANAWDTATVNVALTLSGLLTSASTHDVEAGDVNAAVIGQEICGYQNVTQTGPLAFTLTNFLRGRRASPMTGHGSGEHFVHVTLATVVRVPVPPTLVGWTVLVKVVAPGQTVSDVTPVSLTISASSGATLPTSVPGGSSAYILTIYDVGTVVETNNASANTVTVPPASDVPWVTGQRLDVCQKGAGQTTVVAGLGVTLDSLAGALKLSGQFAVAHLRYCGGDVWNIDGEITT